MTSIAGRNSACFDPFVRHQLTFEIASKINLLRPETFPSLSAINLRFQSFYKCLIDCIHPKYIRKRVTGRGRMGANGPNAKLNFYWISITYTYSHCIGSIKKRPAQKSQPQKVKHIELLSASGIQNMLCTCVNQLYALLIARCTKLTPANACTYVASLICNQKLMKITLQPHFCAVFKKIRFYEINFLSDGLLSLYALNERDGFDGVWLSFYGIKARDCM